MHIMAPVNVTIVLLEFQGWVFVAQARGSHNEGVELHFSTFPSLQTQLNNQLPMLQFARNKFSVALNACFNQCICIIDCCRVGQRFG